MRTFLNILILTAIVWFLTYLTLEAINDTMAERESESTRWQLLK